MSEFAIKPATRQGIKPLVGFYGKSGSGKTMSALLLGRGIVGDSGRIVLVDSESGRGSLFADVIPGGYSVIEINPPFSPARYQQAIDTAAANADCVVVDSLSHEWSGEGGVIDMQDAELDRMAGSDWGKRERCKMAAWIKPKLEHKKFIQNLLRLPVALICCLRGEEKTHSIKEGDKTKVVTDQFSTPLFDPRFIFELLLNFEAVAQKDSSGNVRGGFVVPRKVTHPSIAQLLPPAEKQIGIETGKALAKWCAAPGAAATASKPAEKSVAELKKELWEMTAEFHGKDAARFKQWLVDEALIDPSCDPKELTAANLRAIITEAAKRLDNMP